MAAASYSFLDVAVLDEVRGRFATGDALVVLSADLEELIWANGPGAALFGYSDIMAAMGAPSKFGLAMRRQIAATAGFPAIGRDRSILVRMAAGLSSRAIPFLASEITLPDGEAALLLAAPGAAGGGRSDTEIARRAIGGFSEAGHFVAFVDGSGAVEAASDGFDQLGIEAVTLASLASELAEGGIAKRMLPAAKGQLPAGMARLSGRRFLVVVVDEEWSAEKPLPGRPAAERPEPQETEAAATEGAARQAGPTGGDRPGSEAGHETASSREQAIETAVPRSNDRAAAAADHDSWYFSRDKDQAGPARLRTQLEAGAPDRPQRAAGVAPEAAEAPAATKTGEAEKEPDRISSPARSETAPEPALHAQPAADADDGRAAGADARGAKDRTPVRFVWRTDAEGRFSQISPEFSLAVGEAAADIVGRRFRDVAEALGLDPSGEIAGLLARRDTWSGRSVLWPVAGTRLRIPVDLAALPVYDRNRNFEGFRGFGVARSGDSVVDQHAPGAVPPSGGAAAGETHGPEPAEPPAGPDDALLREAPPPETAPQPDSRPGEKVIRLSEHRQPANDKGLSSGERMAFQQIAERLKKESGVTTGEPPAVPPSRDAQPQKPARGGWEGEYGARNPEPAGGPPGKAVGPGAEPGENQADATKPGTARPVAEPKRGRDSGVKAVPRKPVRPGMSLLDYARWDADRTRGKTRVAGGDSTADAQQAEEVFVADDAAQRNRVEPYREEGAGNSPEAAQAPRTADPEAGEGLPREDTVPQDPAPVSGAADLAGHGPSARDGSEAAEPDTGEVPAAASPVSAPHPAGRRSDTSILEKLPVPVLVHSGDTLHYANAEFLALTGYASVAELDEAGGIGALFADAYEDGEAAEPSDRQLRLRNRDGEESPVKAFLRSAPWNGGKALLLVLTRSRESGPGSGQSPLVAELEAHVAEMRTIIDTATDGVVLISPDGTIRSISRPAEALFGFDSDEIAGKPFTSLFAIESQRAARDYLSGLSDHGVASVLNDGREVIGREAEGRFIPLFMTIGRLPADSGYCAVVRDITQWKRAEEDLTQARAVAERSSAQKSDFLARISHEIRTPLNAIIGFSELMIDEKFGPVANDRYRDYLRDINRSGNHVLDLVNDLLDISKIEAGQQEMAYEAVSLNDTLAETVAMMQPQANRERVIIRSSFASKLPEVVADLRSVRQIALNILSNAVRYTQAGGQVIVSTSYEAAGEVVMRVRDTGIGMTAAEIEQALKPFKQISSLKRARGDGTGLGLPLTKAMVEANRAKFAITSAPGEGTLVEISFPSTRVLAG